MVAVLAALFQFLIMLTNPVVIFLSFFVNAMSRTALFATIYPYLSHHFGRKLFGRLAGEKSRL
jgi:hypothetical protein